MRYVSVGRRLVALLIDGIVLAIAAAPLVETTRLPGYFRIELVGARSVVPFLVWLAYFVVMEASLGATLGKLALGIRVVEPDGTKLDWSSAFVRNIARLVDGFPYVIPYLVGAIAVWSDPTRRRLGDRWAHSVVVDRDSVPTGGSGGWHDVGAAAMSPGSAPTARVEAQPPPPPEARRPTDAPPERPPMPPPPPIPPGSGA